MTREELRDRLSFFGSPDNWPLFYHTARNMQLEQLAGVGERKLRHLVVPALPVDFDARYEAQIPQALPATPGPIRANAATLRQSLSPEQRAQHSERLKQVTDGKLTFLNETVRIERADGPEWFHPKLDDLPELWAEKLWAFEFLAWGVLGTETPADAPEAEQTLRRWVRHWDRSEATGIGKKRYLRRAWTPYSVSLRVVNWCRYYAWLSAEDSQPVLRTLGRLIFKNALFLENHVEYDVGGNHLVENGVALVVAGVLFGDTDEGQRWLATGVDVLSATAEQFLPDGGHFEHSPMYHTIVLARYLTVLDVLREAGEPWPGEIESGARRATDFLQAIRPPDGRIPLLNDAVHGQALEPDDCLAYARAVGIESESPRRDVLSDSGYYWLGEGSDRLLVDGGRFGPPHLPAHSHNDLFSILLWVDGSRLITDTGTPDYDPTSGRTYARSVRAHSTVQVGDREPVDIGGRYLAGRRVQPTVRYRRTDDYSVFDGSYRKRTLRGEAYGHRRRICAGEDWWLVQDTVTSDAEQRVRSRLHFHPQVSVAESGEGFELRVDSEPLAYVLPAGYDDVTTLTTPYFPEFGTKRTRPALRLETTTADTAGTLLSTEPYDTAAYHRFARTVSER